MIPELGSFALLLAFCFACIQALAFRQSLAFVITSACSQAVFLLFAMLCLIFSFIQNDLTVIFVREHSHELLPLMYRVGAAWGGHEGSLLLWCLILSGWTVFFTALSQWRFTPRFHLHTKTTLKTILQVLGMISAGFLAFLIFTSNPFKRAFPDKIITGDDLMPVLQDPGLIFHPPMLYLGYVGFAISFAFAVTALLEKKLDPDWARACRPWVILPWSFLSAGIVLGSWWAYRELGWGGWWFWDPVENASLLPWLSATALIHSLIVSEKRQVFKGWTILLALMTFTLSLLGTFLVRSGVLVSVHAFASDPTRGLFLLCYLALIIGSAFLLYGLRIRYFFQAPRFALFSRETSLLMNSIILITAVTTILLGTLYPIALDAFGLGKISVGEPYFNTLFVPMMLPLLFLMAFAPHVKWEQHSLLSLWKTVRVPFCIILLISLLIPMMFELPFYILSFLGTFAALWVLSSTVLYAVKTVRDHPRLLLHRSAMIAAHIGIAVMALGITLNKSYSEERQVKIMPGEQVEIAGEVFQFEKVTEQSHDNYDSVRAEFSQGLHPEQRIYKSHNQVLSKPGVIYNFWRDIYLALGTELPDNSWSVRLYYKPFVRWIWAGGFLLLLGGFLSLAHYVVRPFKRHEST